MLGVFMTKGPGGDNALLRRDLAQSGEPAFEDVAARAGVAPHVIEAPGAWFGNIDNDLLVVAACLRTKGDGTFTRLITPSINADALNGSSREFDTMTPRASPARQLGAAPRSNPHQQRPPPSNSLAPSSWHTSCFRVSHGLA